MDGGVSTISSNHGIMPPKTEPSSSRPSPSPCSPKNKFDPNGSNENAPPYWTRDHNRTDTVASFDSLMGRGITMADNTTDTSETNAACWAKSVTIQDYETVSGNSLNVGAFVVYNIVIETLSVRTFFPFPSLYHLVPVTDRNTREAKYVSPNAIPNSILSATTFS